MTISSTVDDDDTFHDNLETGNMIATHATRDTFEDNPTNNNGGYERDTTLQVAQRNQRHCRYGWYIIGVMIAILLIIGLAIGVPRNNISSNSDASDDTIDEAVEVEVEEKVSSDSTATAIEPNKVDVDEPPSTVSLEVVNVLPSSSSSNDNIMSSSNVILSSDANNTANEVNDSSDDADTADVPWSVVEDDGVEEQPKDTDEEAVGGKELEDYYLPLFEPEVTIGDAALLLNDDIENVMSALKNHTQGNNNETIITSSSSPPTTLSPTPAPSSTLRPTTTRPTTTRPSSGPTKSPEVVTLEPTPIPSSTPSKVPTNQVRIILN